MSHKSIQETLGLIEEVRGLSFCNTQGAGRINALKASVDAIVSAFATASHLQTVYEEKSRSVEERVIQIEALLHQE